MGFAQGIKTTVLLAENELRLPWDLFGWGLRFCGREPLLERAQSPPVPLATSIIPSKIRGWCFLGQGGAAFCGVTGGSANSTQKKSM